MLGLQELDSARASEAAALDRVVQQLSIGLPAVPPEQIADAVHAEYRRFEHSPIRDFIPILVERVVRQRYRGAAYSLDAPG